MLDPSHKPVHATRLTARSAKIIVTVGAVLLAAYAQTASQVPVSATDPNGVAIPYRRVRLVHSADVRLRGATAHLRDRDPFLLYQLGRDLVQLQFAPEDGAYGRAGELSVPLYAVGNVRQVTHGSEVRFGRDHTNSCGLCHSIPYREPGGGQTIASTSGNGRNTPHFYGSGLVEMLAEQTRRKIFLLYDTNGNGVIDREEVRRPSPARISPAPGTAPVDYGDLAPGADGVPQLNPIFRVWYLDAAGRVLPDAYSLNDARAASFDLAMQPFGWGRGYRSLGNGLRVTEGGEAATLRGIYTAAADVHLGMQAYDPAQQQADAAGDKASAGVGGLAAVSLNGAQQFDFGGSTDAGLVTAGGSLSLDDPDGDGQVSELTEGDIDAAEFYMLHSPAPAVRPDAGSEAGRALLRRVGCVSCHVEDWRIEGRDAKLGYKGDRRLFRFDVGATADREGASQLRGRLVPLWRRDRSGALVAKGAPFLVRRIYTDLKHWDIGPNFHERRFDMTLQREHRTAPLWGVGSTAPYGHAGQYMTLHEVIAAHGGHAAPARVRYLRLTQGERRLLIAYLESLVLYHTDEIPADIDGDGAAAPDLTLGGERVGYERFDARFLFAVRPRYRILHEVANPEGRRFALSLIDNVPEAYGLNLPYRRDADADGFPDVIDPLPQSRGVK